MSASPTLAQDLGTAVRRLRTAHGLTQRQLAALLQTSHSAVSRLESGRHLPRIETLDAIARALHHPFALTFNPDGTWEIAGRGL